MFVNTGTGLKRHLPSTAWHFAQDVRPQDVAGHQVRRELHPIELEVQRLPKRFDQRRLADAGQAFQQNVSATQNANQHHADAVAGGRATCASS